jgi:excinuclease ABC subunit B
VRAELEARLEELRRTGRFAEADRLRQRVGDDLEAFVKEGYCKGLENYSRAPRDETSEMRPPRSRPAWHLGEAG